MFGLGKDESTRVPEGLDPDAGWGFPNQTPVVDGVVPVDEVPQDEDFFDDEIDPELEMED